MKPKLQVISLPVADPQKSLAFYRDCLGFPTQGADEGIITFELEGGLNLYLIQSEQFAKYTGRANLQPHVLPSSVECILSAVVFSDAAVDQLLDRVGMAGGLVRSRPTREEWGYTGYFQDPDGHLWEVVSVPQEVEKI